VAFARFSRGFSGAGTFPSSRVVFGLTVTSLRARLLLMNKAIRFYGTDRSLARWSEVVSARTGRTGQVALDKASVPANRPYLAVRLSAADLHALKEDWYALSGLGETATGRPYRWNDCITWVQA
jgi:hypothetical protein